MKTCTKCQEQKELNCFGKRTRSVDGLNYWCKPCMSNNDKKWRENNPDKIKAKNQTWISANPERRKANQAKYYQKNKIRLRPIVQAGYNRRMKDPLYKTKTRYRNRVAQMYHFGEFKKTSRSIDMVGCTWDQLQAHLISTALSRYGIWCAFDSYEIDHMIPLMIVKSHEDLVRLNHFTNLQLLTPSDHMQKTIQDRRSFMNSLYKLSYP